MTQVLPRRVPRARSYLLRLLGLIPAVAMLATGWWYYTHFEQGGTVDAIKLSTKSGLVGQASEAVDLVTPTTPDLYLVVTLGGGAGTLELPIKKDTPIGNGLTWDLPRTMNIAAFQRVEVWDHHTFTKNKQLDHITLSGWDTDGQRYHVELIGKKNEPPQWALPLAAAGAALTGVIVLKFIWDQVI
jgi:hypothetical protein